MRLVPLCLIAFIAHPTAAETVQESAGSRKVPVSVIYTQRLEFSGLEAGVAKEAAAWLRRELLEQAVRSTCVDLMSAGAVTCDLDSMTYQGQEDTLPHGVRMITGSVTAQASIMFSAQQEP